MTVHYVGKLQSPLHKQNYGIASEVTREGMCTRAWELTYFLIVKRQQISQVWWSTPIMAALEIEAGGLPQVCGCPGLHIECQASQGYIEKNKSVHGTHSQNAKKQNGTKTVLEM